MMWKRKLIALMERAGIGIHRVNRHQVLPVEIEDLDCYRGPEDQSRLFRPWLAEEFRRALHHDVVSNTMLSAQKLYTLRQLLRSALSVDGDIFEAGTCSGGGARLMLDTAIASNHTKTFWLLDTFEGHKRVDPSRDGSHVKLSDCRGNAMEKVKTLFEPAPMPVHLVPGLIPETLASVTAKKICFAHIDVNLYEPTAAATDFCLERMPIGAIMLFDDYNWPATYGARLAIDRVAKQWRQNIISIPESTQAFLIRTP